MKIYTRGGDKGMTGLFGGTRVSKASIRLHAYGTLDELNACLGSVVADGKLPAVTKDQLLQIQSLLFQIGADLATPLESPANIFRMNGSSATMMETWIDAMEKDLVPLSSFILPGGSPAGAKLHEARTICRRAERWIVELAEREKVTEAIIIIVNRLSDYLFVAARFVNHELKIPESTVEIPRQESKQSPTKQLSRSL
jgi:cob(I)alamin adenosyltransferase